MFTWLAANLGVLVPLLAAIGVVVYVVLSGRKVTPPPTDTVGPALDARWSEPMTAPMPASGLAGVPAWFQSEWAKAHSRLQQLLLKVKADATARSGEQNPVAVAAAHLAELDEKLYVAVQTDPALKAALDQFRQAAPAVIAALITNRTTQAVGFPPEAPRP